MLSVSIFFFGLGIQNKSFLFLIFLKKLNDIVRLVITSDSEPSDIDLQQLDDDLQQTDYVNNQIDVFMN